MKEKILYLFFGLIMIFLVGLIIKEAVNFNEIPNNTEVSEESNPTIEQPEIPDVKKADKVEIVNFHATQRCVSCEIMGKLSEKTIKEKFAKEIESGKVIFKSVNGELPENKEITTLYQASGSSLYINAIKDGENNIVQNVKVWQYLGDELAFISYLEGKIKELL